MSANEVIQTLKRDNPNTRFAVNADSSAIAYYSETLGRFVPVLGTPITDREAWFKFDSELLIDGRPLPIEWTEAR